MHLKSPIAGELDNVSVVVPGAYLAERGAGAREAGGGHESLNGNGADDSDSSNGLWWRRVSQNLHEEIPLGWQEAGNQTRQGQYSSEKYWRPPPRPHAIHHKGMKMRLHSHRGREVSHARLVATGIAEWTHKGMINPLRGSPSFPLAS